METNEQSKIAQWYRRLNPRERKLVVVWVIAMIGIALFLLSTTVLGSLTEMEEKIEANVEALDLISRKQSQYIEAKGGGGGDKSMDKRLANNKIKLTTYLDKEANRYDVKIDNFKEGSGAVGGRKPKKGEPVGVTEEWVTVDINQAEYGKLVRFFDAIKTSRELIVIKRIEVTRQKRGRNQDKVDAKMTVSTFKKGES